MLNKSAKQAAADARLVMMNARLEYAEHWSTFPAPSDGAKKSLKSKVRSNGVNWGATKNVKVIAREFRQHRFRDQNIGIPTGIGNRFFVVETDTAAGHNVDGAASLRALEKKHGKLPPTLMARSPTGSMHYYFKHPGKGKTIKNSVGKIAPGVDVRGDGGMVLAPPSFRPPQRAKNGKPAKLGGLYRWVNKGHRIAAPPAWLLDLVTAKAAAKVKLPAETKTKVKVKSSERNVFQRARDDLQPLADPALVEYALKQINVDSYPTWMTCGAALANEFGSAGEAMFHRWTATSKKYPYDKAYCRKKWNELSAMTEIGIGSLFYLANKASPRWRVVYETQLVEKPSTFLRRLKK